MIPNKYEIHGNICLLHITKRNKTIVTTFLDKKDYERVRYTQWIENSGYIRSSPKLIPIHRFILNAPRELEIDHKNSNTLDNRRKNLRLCTHKQNSASRKKNKNNTTGYKGIFYCRPYKCWDARIGRDKRTIHLGRFDNKIEAARAYNEAAKKLHGEFAKLNRGIPSR